MGPPVQEPPADQVSRATTWCPYPGNVRFSPKIRDSLRGYKPTSFSWRHARPNRTYDPARNVAQPGLQR